MWLNLRYLCLATVVLCIEQPRVENVEGFKQSFPFRRAVDGRRGRKYFNLDDDGSYNSYNSASGNYYESTTQVKQGSQNIRSNVPGEPGVDYPAYHTVPKTRFSCAGRVSGYYADEDAGCQAFHVCNNVVVSSFICPVGSIFSQKLLTCNWWNRVDCRKTEAYYPSHQEIYTNDNEMIEKAQTMIQPLVPNSVKSANPQIGIIRELETTNIRSKENIGGDNSRKNFFAPLRTEETQFYNNNPVKSFGIYRNFQFGKNIPDVVNENTRSEKSIININLRPENFQFKHLGENSRLNNRAKDSSITYVQKNFNYNNQDSYSTSKPFIFPNYENSFQFQSSYAPTVPTVTTTTRRLYTATVPTTYRPSTTSYYNNLYDQHFQNSDHFYAHGKSQMTTQSSISYDDTTMDSPVFLQVGQQYNDGARTGKSNRQFESRFGGVIQSEEGIGAGNFGAKLNTNIKSGSREAKSQIGTNLRSRALKEQETSLANSRSSLENTRTNFDLNASDQRHHYQHFYSKRVLSDRKQDLQLNDKPSTVSMNNNNTQLFDTDSVRNESVPNFVESRLGEVPPLIVQIPRPTGPAGRPVTDIADQLFAFESSDTIPSSTPETTSSEFPQSVGSSGSDSSSDSNNDNMFDSSSTRPPLIPQIPQDTGTSGSDSPTTVNGDNAFDSTSRIPPLIPQFPQSTESSGSDSSSNSNGDNAFDSTSRIPPLIPQFPQDTGTSGSDSPTTVNGDNVFDSTSIIPPLIPQFPQSTRIPPLIPQFPQDTGTSGSDPPTTVNGDNAFDSTSRIPPLIPGFPQSTGSSGSDSSSNGNGDNAFDSPSRIPPLIPQFPQDMGMSGSDSPTTVNGDNAFDSPSGIPPLIPQFPQSTGSSGSGSSSNGNGDNAFDSPSRIPPLIPQFPQSTGSSGSGSSSNGNGDNAFDSPSRIPPLIPQFPQSTESSGSDSFSNGNGDNAFDSPSRIPPLIPQFPQSTESSGSDSSSNGNGDNVFDSASRIPPLIPQYPQSTESSASDSSSNGNGDNAFDSPSRIPPLIPQFPPSMESPGSDSSSDGNDDNTFDSPSRIPPLIPQFPQSTGSSGLDSTTARNDDNTFDLSSRIPPLIPQSPQSTESAGSDSFSNGNVNSAFDSPSGIPPLIPQFPQSTGSSGSDSSSDGNDDNTFDSPSRIPPLIPQFPQPTGSSGLDSTTARNDDNTFDLPSRIPPLIPQSPQSTESAGSDSSSNGNGNSAFDSPSKIPPLIPQFPQSTGSSGSDSSSDGNDDNMFDSPSRIPPLIPQFPQSTGSSGLDSTTARNDDNTFDLPSRIPPLIPQFPQSMGSSGLHSTTASNDDNTFDLPSRIPPLIPQIIQSTGSSGIDSSTAASDDNAFDSPSRIPPLIPQFSQSTESAESVSSTAASDDNAFDSPSRIPPLIPQFSQSTESAESVSSTAASDDNAFDSPSRIPPLIPQFPQSSGSSGSESSSTGSSSSALDSSSRIPPLIPQFPQFTGSSGLDSSSNGNDDNSFDLPSRIPPLIPQFSQSTGLSGSDFTTATNDDSTFDSPSKIPPLIPQFPQSAGPSGSDSSYNSNGGNAFGSSTRIPPLISQFPQSTGSSGLDSSTAANDDHTFDSPSRIPPLIPQFPQSTGSSESDSSTAANDDHTFDSPSRIPPLIPQSPQSTGSSGLDSSTATNDDHTFDSTSRIPPLIPQFPQFTGSSGSDSSPDRNGDNAFDLPSRIKPLIPQTSQSVGSSGFNPTDVNDRPQILESSTKIPPLIPSASQSMTSPQPNTINDNSAFDRRQDIPPLISQVPQCNDTANVALTGFDHRIQVPESSTPLSPLSPQPSQPTAPSLGTQYPYAPYDNGPFYLLPMSLKPPHISVNQYSGWPPKTSDSAIADGLPHTFKTNTGTPPLVPPTSFSNDLFGAHFSGYSDRGQIFKSSSTLPKITPFNSQISRPFELPEIHITNIFKEEENSHSSDKTQSSIPHISPLVDSPGTYSKNVFNPTTPQPAYFTFEGQYQSPIPFNHFQTPTPDREFATTPTSNIAGYDYSIKYGTKLRTETSTISPLVQLENSATKEFRINITDIPNIVSSSPPPINYSEVPISSEKTVLIPNVNRSSYNLFKQASAEIPSISDIQKPSGQDVTPGNWVEYNDDLQFTIRGAVLHPSAPGFPTFDTIPSNYGPPSGGSRDSIPVLQNNNVISISSQPPSDNLGYFEQRFVSSYTTKLGENHNDSKQNELLQPTQPSSSLPELPPGFAHIESSLNNNDSPYEISITVNGDEDFDPSGDFITKLLAQRDGNFPLGLEGLEGYEIIKSDNPFGPDNQDVKPAPLPDVKPSIDPPGQRIFDPRSLFQQQSSISNSDVPILKTTETHPIKIENLPKSESLSNQSTESIDDFSDQNSNADTAILKNFESHLTGIKNLPNSDNRPRPFDLGIHQETVLLTKPNSPTLDSSLLNGSLEDKGLQNSINLSKLNSEAKDIESSLEPLSQVVSDVTRSPPPKKEQILEELTKYLGQPLYTGNSQRYFPTPEAPRNVDYNVEQQFANLQQYRVGKTETPEHEAIDNSTTPSPSSSTTTTTSQPVKTYVETEFIPSLSFSFDSDDGRNEYVEAVLQGLLAENQPIVYPWSDDTNFYRESRDNSKSANRNNTTDNTSNSTTTSNSTEALKS